jgi:hypothetical protein
MFMRSLSLHDDQWKILNAVRSALSKLNLTEHIAIVGSLAKYLDGSGKPPGDIDMLIEEPICVRYWELIEILTENGINSGWEVYDPPGFPTWSPCHPDSIQHAMHYAVGCSSSYHDHKAGHLDFCFTTADLAKIPNSSKWVRRPVSSQLTGTALVKAIEEGHRDLVNVVKERERKLLPAVFSEEVQFYYRLIDPSESG